MNRSALALLAASILAAPGSAATLNEEIRADLPQLMPLYRDLHANPELSMQEVRTPAKLAPEMRKLGFAVTEHVGKTGVVVGGEQDLEIVGHDSLALDVDGAVVVHLTDETAPELDRPDGVVRTAEHAIDHTL